ncbi:MAG: hypothetical protein H0X31_22495 [Nostocaceae cyanobacterium]|nr:hypothetical protein [Nostocaceae cyanobacterium]
MCYVNSFEHLAVISNKHESVIQALELRFHQVPKELVEQIQAIDNVLVLKKLHRQAILLDSIESFSQALIASGI